VRCFDQPQVHQSPPGNQIIRVEERGGAPGGVIKETGAKEKTREQLSCFATALIPPVRPWSSCSA
jgi:hypothetical protein